MRLNLVSSHGPSILLYCEVNAQWMRVEYSRKSQTAFMTPLTERPGARCRQGGALLWRQLRTAHIWRRQDTRTSAGAARHGEGLLAAAER
jgi:hypothetical protein